MFAPVGCVPCLQSWSSNSHSWALRCAWMRLVLSQRFACERWCREDTPSFPWRVSSAAPQTCLSSSGIWRGLSRCSSRWLEPCGNTRGLTLYLLTGRGYFSSRWGWWLLQQLTGLPAGLSLGTSGCSVQQLHIHPRGEIQTVSLAFGTRKVERVNYLEQMPFPACSAWDYLRKS